MSRRRITPAQRLRRWLWRRRVTARIKQISMAIDHADKLAEHHAGQAQQHTAEAGALRMQLRCLVAVQRELQAAVADPEWMSWGL